MPESATKTESMVEPAAMDAASAPSAWTSIRATLAAICVDSASAPDKYLEDTVVPHGGE